SCPVCGSKEHVQLAEGEDHTSGWQDRIRRDEQQREALNEQFQNAKQLQYKLEQLSDLMTEEEERSAELLENDLPKVNRKLTNDEIVTEMKSLAQDVQGLEEKIKQEGKLLQEVRSKETEYAYRLEQVEGYLKERREKRIELTNQSEELEKKLLDEVSLSIHQIDAETKRMEEMDQQADVVRDRLTKSVPYIEEKEQRLVALQESVQQYSVRKAELTSSQKQLSEQVEKTETEYKNIAGDMTAEAGYHQIDEQLKAIRNEEKNAAALMKEAEERYQQTERKAAADQNYDADVRLRLKKALETYKTAEEASIFSDRKRVREANVPPEIRKEWEKRVEAYRKEWNQTEHALQELGVKLSDRRLTEEEWQEAIQRAEDAKTAREEALSEFAACRHHLEDVRRRHERYTELEESRKTAGAELEKLGKLQTVFRGNSFVEFIASEQLEQVSLDASQKLGDLTSQRYAIEVDSSGGFLIRDDANGGVRRPVSTLSGGETFLTSLALALALSGQIQLRGAHPLQFFFLDEGFGTLDESLLDTVITSLEKLQNESLSVGVISHVPELRARLPRKVIV
ncbi:MAG: SbcC/MukB-like Walker B domain-containing protein, partial [Anaerobacillus sp.]